MLASHSECFTLLMMKRTEKESPYVVDYMALQARLGKELLGQRLLTQANHWADTIFQGESIFKLERYFPMDRLIRWILMGTGIYWWGHHNFFDIQVTQNTVSVPDLPQTLDGFRILHLSDLHLDLCPPIANRIVSVVEGLSYDLVVITGDYRNSSTGNHADAIALTRQIVEHLRPPVLGVLGNHDFIEMVPGLEATGLELLLNETTTVTHQGTPILVAGLDDPHFYQTENFETLKPALGKAPFQLLLSHSPETYRSAASYGFHLVLCGHTHGGQICLPNGKAIMKIGNCPDEMLSGAWEYHGLAGYTSRGTGSCGVPVRFFCPPEVVVHELVAKS